MTTRVRAVKVPADVNQPDRVFYSLTLRQLVLLGGTAFVLWVLYRLLQALLPPIVLLIGAVPVAALAVAIAIGRRDGLPLDRWLWHAFRAARSPKRLAPAAVADARVAVLRLPATRIGDDGVVTVAGGGYAVIVAVGTVGFFLRNPDGQDAMLDGFARWCASLAVHTQITVSTGRSTSTVVPTR
jgi:hypothetical protein